MADLRFAEDTKGYGNEIENVLRGVKIWGIKTGGAVTQRGAGANMSVDVASLIGEINNISIITSSTTNVVVTAAHGSLDRIDIVVINSGGTISVQAGTPASAPLPVAIPANSIMLARLLIPASVSQVVDGDITDERVFIPTAHFPLDVGLDMLIDLMENNARDSLTTIDYNDMIADFFSDSNGYKNTIDTGNTDANYDVGNKKYLGIDTSVEKLTTFTEVDGPGRLTVTQPKVTITGLAASETVYLYRSVNTGTAFPSNDWSLDFEVRITAGSNGNFSIGFGDTVGRVNAQQNAIIVRFDHGGGNYRFFIYKYVSGTPTAGSTIVANTLNTQRCYATLSRVTNTFKIEVFSDSARTTSLGSSTVTDSMSNNNFDYYYAQNSMNDSGSYTISGYIENLELLPDVTLTDAIVQTNLLVTETDDICSVQVQVKSPSSSTLTFDVSSDNGATWTTEQTTDTKINITSTQGTQLILKFNLDDETEDISGYAVTWWII